MKIDFEEIKEMLQTATLTEVSRRTGIAYRTLQDWKLSNNKWLIEAEERLTKLQKYIKEVKKMENTLYQVSAFIVRTSGEHHNYDIEGYADTKEEVAKQIEHDLDNLKMHRGSLGVSEVQYEVYELDKTKLEDEGYLDDVFGGFGKSYSVEYNSKRSGSLELVSSDLEEIEVETSVLIAQIQETVDEDRELYSFGLYDVYYQPSDNQVWLEVSGNEYRGNDEKAKQIAQLDDGEIFWT